MYRDLIQTSLLVDARFLVLAVQVSYRHKTGGKEVVVQTYRNTRILLDAIYASQRLELPLDGSSWSATSVGVRCGRPGGGGRIAISPGTVTPR